MYNEALLFDCMQLGPELHAYNSFASGERLSGWHYRSIACNLIPSCMYTIRLPAEKDYPAGITVRMNATWSRTHGSSGPTDWECMLLISNGGVRLHVVILVMETGRVIETRTFAFLVLKKSPGHMSPITCPIRISCRKGWPCS